MEQLLTAKTLTLIIYLWTLPWKGLALWRAAQRKEKYWFIFMLLINSLALVEILYLYVFSRDEQMAKIKKFFSRLKK